MRTIGLAVIFSQAWIGLAQGQVVSEWVDPWRATHEAEIVRTLADFAAIPSVATDPAELGRMADTLQAELARRGFQNRLLEGGANAPPMVFGQFLSPGARRTVVFYAHFDGQPVVKSEWHSDPFRPTLRQGVSLSDPAIDLAKLPRQLDPEWRLFGRAVSDDKSSIVAFLAAWDAMRATGRKPSVNIKVLWDGEEESGSPNLAEIVERNRALLSADLWLMGDGALHASRRRTVQFGTRGTLSVGVTVYGPLHPLHSGFYGNWVPNPGYRIAELITQLRGPDGSVKIPGFDADIRAITAAERSAIAALPPVEASLRTQFGFARAETEEPLSASVMRPAISVTRLRAGGPEQAIPARAEATLNFRLVPDQTPERVRSQVEAYLGELGWTVVSTDPDVQLRQSRANIVKLEWDAGYAGYRSDMSSPAAKAFLNALKGAANEPVVVVPMIGASLPIGRMATTLGVPIIGLPVFNHDSYQHAPDENIRLADLWGGITSYAALLTNLRW